MQAKTHNVNCKGVHKMKKIELLDNAAAAGKSLSEQGINYYFYHAYKNSKEAKLETLNFYDEIKSDEIVDVVAACKKFKITEFTLSDRSTCGIERLAEFQQAGCKVTGLTEVKSHREELDGDCEFVTKTLPAMMMQVM